MSPVLWIRSKESMYSKFSSTGIWRKKLYWRAMFTPSAHWHSDITSSRSPFFSDNLMFRWVNPKHTFTVLSVFTNASDQCVCEYPCVCVYVFMYLHLTTWKNREFLSYALKDLQYTGVFCIALPANLSSYCFWCCDALSSSLKTARKIIYTKLYNHKFKSYELIHIIEFQYGVIIIKLSCTI